MKDKELIVEVLTRLRIEHRHLIKGIGTIINQLASVGMKLEMTDLGPCIIEHVLADGTITLKRKTTKIRSHLSPLNALEMLIVHYSHKE